MSNDQLMQATCHKVQIATCTKVTCGCISANIFYMLSVLKGAHLVHKMNYIKIRNVV